jgi:NADH-quinone oxidoreductase subunit A
MNAFLLQYLPIVIFLGIAAALGVAFVAAAAIFAPKAPDPEKLSSYECGFNAFDDARMKFDIRFYLVSILFIIFDLEVAFLFPWAVSLMRLPPELSQFAFWSMMTFLGVLTVGFIYEWKKGALEWE